MAATPDGKGYWLVGADGGIFSFGDAGFYGSAGSANLPDSVVGMVASPDGGGYLIATANGVVLNYGDAQAFGGLSLDPTATQISAIIGNNEGTGYWLLDPQAWAYSFTTATAEPEFPQSAAIADAVASQIEPDPDTEGPYCNPYGPCEEWCALFATWAWEQAGVPIPRYAFTGDIWGWAATYGAVLPPTAMPAVGDAVLYGTGPWSTATSVHVGIVTEVWPDDAIMTVARGLRSGRRRVSLGEHRRALPAGRLRVVQRLAHLRLRAAVGPRAAALTRASRRLPAEVHRARLRISLLDLSRRLRRAPAHGRGRRAGLVPRRSRGCTTAVPRLRHDRPGRRASGHGRVRRPGGRRLRQRLRLLLSAPA